MPRRQWILTAVASLMVVLSIGWAAAAGKNSLRKPIDWARVNPAFAGATFVNDAAKCRECHEDSAQTFAHTKHAQSFTRGEKLPGGECETCHGPMSKHIDDQEADVSFKSMTATQQSAVCLQCHDGGKRFGWKAGAHQHNDVSCASCHYVMDNKSERAMLVKSNVTQTCYTCHAEMRTEQQKMSHHPVREGRMDCASCHNSHSSNPALLRKNTLNETCTSCHTEKRGPFLWEHAPVRESCANCHTPHGSNNRNLLIAKDSFLCLGCHSYGGHINLPRYNRTSNSYGTGCVNCHITTHGSNHPSGAKQTR
jgi:DmsE family decaheme c-type cytochrome